MKTASIFFALYLIWVSALFAFDSMVVLQYHHFGTETPHSTSVTPSRFEEHLDYLEDNGYTVWSMQKGIDHLLNGKSLPEKCVAITVDDAYISVYTEAYPRMLKRNWPFTVFVATEPVDNGLDAFMSWDQMREMQRNGVSFETHSHTHAYMVRNRDEMSENEWKIWAKKEIETNRRRLEEELGHRSMLFAYPYGEYDPELKEVVKQMGLIGIGQHSGSIWKGSDYQALPRFPMAGDYTEMKQFALKVRSLPLPVISTIPENPVLKESVSSPLLRLELAEGEYRLEQLNCFASGQGKIRVNWVDRNQRIVVVEPHKPLPYGRSRYNCTAPHKTQNAYFWFSHPWLRLKR